MKDKAAWRHALREQRRAVPAGERKVASETACAQLMASPEWQAARCVSVYQALPGEIDVAVLVEDAVRRGCRVGLPVVRGREEPLELRCFADGSFRASLRPGPMGLSQPGEDAPVLRPEEIDLVVVPALAIDRAGNRLGFGAGYYDRTLPLLVRALRVVVLFPFQLVEALPHGPRDVPVHVAFTPQGRVPLSGAL